MTERNKEIIGFLCRWTLMGCAWGTIIVVVYIGISAVGFLDDELKADMTLSDSMYVQNHKSRPRLSGYMNFISRYGDSSLAVSCDKQNVQHGLIWSKNKRFSAWLNEYSLGSNKVFVNGLPYGPLAYRKGAGQVVIVPEGAQVSLVDAGWALEMLQADKETFGQFMLSLRRRGQSAFFHTDNLSKFSADSKKIKEVYPETPQLFFKSPKRPFNTLWHIRWALSLTNEKCYCRVFTNDEKLVRIFGETKFQTNYIDSLSTLKEYLLIEPSPR